MSFLQMGKAGLFSLAIAPIVGTSVSFGDSQWTVFIGFALILLVSGVVVGRKMARGKRQYRSLEPAARTTGDKLSSQLVALSSAAIIAVYSAGYFRTNAAARQFEEQSAQMRLTASAITGLPTAAYPAGKSAVSASSTTVSQNTTGDAASGLAASRPASTSATPSATAELPAGKSAAVSAKANSHHGSGSADGVAAAADQAPATPATPPSPYKDGTYAAWGSCPHGNLEATIVIASGLIVAADVTQCQTQYPCNMISKLTNEVVYQQSPNVDVVTGATDSAAAFHMAVSQALAQAVQAMTQSK